MHRRGLLKSAVALSACQALPALGADFFALPPLNRTKHVAVVGGQSLGEYYFTHGVPPVVAISMGRDILTALGIAPANAFAEYGTFPALTVHNGSSQNATNWTVKCVNTASNGSSINDSTPSTASDFPGVNNYWWNTNNNTAVTGDPTDLPNTPGPLLKNALSIMATLSRVDSFIFPIGESDASFVGSNTTRAAQDLAQRILICQTIRASYPNIIFIQPFLGMNDGGNTQGTQLVRQNQITLTQTIYACYPVEQYAARRANFLNIPNCIKNGTTLILCSNTAGMLTGSQMNGPGIPGGNLITTITANVSFVITHAATDSNTDTLYQLDVVHLYPGPSTAIQPFDFNGNTQYNPTQGFYRTATEISLALAVAYSVPGAAPYLGPDLTRLIATAGSPIVDLVFTHRGNGTDLMRVDGGAIDKTAPGFLIVVNGVNKTISSLAKLGSSGNTTTLRATLSSSPTSGQTVGAYVAGFAMQGGDTNACVVDNGSFYLPISSTAPAVNSAAQITV